MLNIPGQLKLAIHVYSHRRRRFHPVLSTLWCKAVVLYVLLALYMLCIRKKTLGPGALKVS